MLKTVATLTAATFLSLVGPEAWACDKEKHASAAQAQRAPDERDTQVLAKGEGAEVTGTVTCSTCAEKKPGPCSLTLKDASGASYSLTANRTTRAIHTMAAQQGAIEVRGRTLRENGMAYLAPTSFRFVTASEATSTASAPPAQPGKADAPKKHKDKGCCH